MPACAAPGRRLFRAQDSRDLRSCQVGTRRFPTPTAGILAAWRPADADSARDESNAEGVIQNSLGSRSAPCVNDIRRSEPQWGPNGVLQNHRWRGNQHKITRRRLGIDRILARLPNLRQLAVVERLAVLEATPKAL